MRLLDGAMWHVLILSVSLSSIESVERERWKKIERESEAKRKNEREGARQRGGIDGGSFSSLPFRQSPCQGALSLLID